MNNQIIEAMDHLGEKLGLAIDWSADNIYPQIIDFMARFKTYHIITDIIWMILLAGIIGGFIWWKLTLKKEKEYSLTNKTDTLHFRYYSYKDDSSLKVDPDVGTTVFMAAAIVAGLIFVAVMFNLVKWIVVPEERFFYALSNLIQR